MFDLESAVSSTILQMWKRIENTRRKISSHRVGQTADWRGVGRGARACFDLITAWLSSAPIFSAYLAAYLFVNIIYSRWIKHVPILDVLFVRFGLFYALARA
ncbi:MAG: hypothetical protein U0X93_18660 [Anaerolineales bacterium]